MIAMLVMAMPAYTQAPNAALQGHVNDLVFHGAEAVGISRMFPSRPRDLAPRIRCRRTPSPMARTIPMAARRIVESRSRSQSPDGWAPGALPDDAAEDRC
jgi:hypothetical protein